MITPKLGDENLFKAKIVHLIADNNAEQALAMLSEHYHVSVPKLKVGMPKGEAKHQGCYVGKTKTIHIANGSNLNDPYMILHEFYHHLRTSGTTHVHRGTEKNAEKFAKDYIATFYTYSAASP